MLGSQVCIQPESSKVFIPPTITVTSTTDSELEFSRSPSSISLVSSDCTNTSHLNAFDDGDDNDDGAGAQSSSKKISVSSCELTSNVNDYQSSLSSSIIPTVRCNSTYPSSMHSPMASGISLYSSSSINNADDNLHKLSLDEIYNSSDIFSSTFNDQTQPPVGFSNQHVNASSLFSHANPECSTSLRPVRSLNGFFQSGASNTCVYSSTTSKHDHSLPHGRQYPENRVGFICLCHGYDGKNQDITLSPKVDSNVTLFDKTLASLPSLSSSSSMVSSSPSSPNNTTSQHQQNGGNPSVKQSRTLLRRFRSFIIQSVRKSGRSVNVNENDKVLCTKGDSVVVKYKVTDRNKKRSKSLRAISNCILSTASVSPSTSPNGVHHRNEMKEKDKSSRSSRRHRLRLHSDHGEQSDWPTCFNDNGHTDDNFLTNSCRQLGIVSKAVEKFISILNEVLDYLSYNNNGSNVNHNNNNNNNNNSGATTSRTIHQLQELCKQTLVELVIVLQCRQFIGDFVKYEGHCKLFQLVETIDKLDKTFHDQIWLHLLSCLVELSKYAITNRFSGDDDDGGAEGGGDNRKTIFPGSCCAASVDYTQYSSEEIIATQKTSQNVSKVNCSSTILTRSIGSHGSAVGREEFFSWQLVSDHFLSVIIDHCRRENNFDCLRHEMKLILKIIIDYPVRIQYVIEQTKHGFILDLLKMINISTAQYKSSVSIALQVDEIRCEMQNLIMKLLYVLLYYGKQNKCLTLLVPQYLENIRFIEWIPELSNRSLWESIIAIYHSPPPPPHYHHHQRRQQQQQYQYEQLGYSVRTLDSCFNSDLFDDNSEITLVLKRMKEFSSILEENDRMCEAEEKGEGNMHNSVINNDESIGQQGSISRQLSNGNNMKQLSSVQLLGSLCRVQQIVNSLLVTELNTPLDRKSEINIEKMNQLCSVVYFEEYTMNPTTESMEEAFTKLGFKIPTDPYADFEESPGSLGFHCVYAYVMKNRNKLTDMLNYAYPHYKYPSFTNYRKSNFLSEFPTCIMHYNNSFNVFNNLCDEGAVVGSGGDGAGGGFKNSRVHRHFSTVDSNYIKHLLNNSQLCYDNQQYNSTGRRFTVDSVSSNLSQTYKPIKGLISGNSSRYYSSSTISLIDKKPLFPIIEAANAVTKMLCELISLNSKLPDPQFIIEQNTSEFHLPSSLYPILLSHHNPPSPHRHHHNLQGNSPFEDLFDCVFSTLFYAWTQMKAVPEDLPSILCVVREHINRILRTTPISFEEFEKSLANFNPYDVPSMWSNRENCLRVNMLHNHPALIQLRNDLRKRHQGNVYENRLNILSTSAPLEYIPSKGSKLCSKDNQLFTVLLSADRKSLVIRDASQTVREIWPLKCIIRVSLGISEKVKKNPERTLIFQVEVSDISNQDDSNEAGNFKSRSIRVSLLARSIIEYHYWLDGLYLLNKLSNPSDYYNEDVERLIDLDMRIRLSSLDLNQLPKREIIIPPDPPPLDFV